MKGYAEIIRSLLLVLLATIIIAAFPAWPVSTVRGEASEEDGQYWIWELADGEWISGGQGTEEEQRAVLLHGLSGVRSMARALKIEVHPAYKTVKCSYNGQQSWSDGGRSAIYDIQFTMNGTYAHPSPYENVVDPGMKGQYTYKAHIVDTAPSGKTSSNDVSIKGSFLNKKPLAEGDYVISFGPGTGTWVDAEGTDSITVPSWSVAFTARKKTKISGTRFSGISGIVEVLIPGEKTWRAATYNMHLPVGTHIRTEDDSTCLLSFADLSTFVLKPSCEIVLESPPEKDTKVHLLTGNVWTNVKKIFKEGSMEIEMNQAVCGQRGTTLVCEETGSTSTVKVIEGSVYFKSKKTGQSVDVGAGYTVTATSAGLGKKTTFNISQEQARWKNGGSSTSSGSVIDDIQQDQVRIQGDDDSMSSGLLPQDGSGSSSGTSGQTGTTKKHKIGPFSCFIATAVYGSETALELDTLRAFRDSVLMKNEAGRLFVDAYYACSSPLADYIAEHEGIRVLVRLAVLDPIIYILDKSRPVWNN